MNTKLHQLYKNITSSFDNNEVDSYKIKIILEKMSSSATIDSPNFKIILDLFQSLIDIKTKYFYKALETLQDLVEKLPDVSQFQYAIAILYCNIGRLEDAIFAYKCSLAGKSLPELDGWLPTIGGTFQEHFENIDEEPLYYQSKTIYKHYDQINGIALMREACLCNKNNLDYWAELSYQLFYQKHWYECYQALRPLIKNDCLDDKTYRYLLTTLQKIGMYNKASELYSTNNATPTNDFLIKHALVHDKNDELISKYKFKKKDPPVVTKKLSASTDVLNIAVIAGIINQDTINFAFLDLLGGFLETINIKITLFHEADYITPWVQSIFDLFSNNFNASSINTATLKEIIKRENFSLMIDASELEGDKRILHTNNIPTILFGEHPKTAELYGYDASLVDKFMIDGHDVSNYEKKSKVIICQEPLFQCKKPHITEKQLRMLVSSKEYNFISLSLPSIYNRNIKDKITKIVKALPKDWSLIIDSIFYGGQSTCSYLLESLDLEQEILDKIAFASIYNTNNTSFTHAMIDVFGQPSVKALSSSLTKANPILSLDALNAKNDRSFFQENFGAVLLKQYSLTETLFHDIDSLCLFLFKFCSDSAFRFKTRNNVLKKLNEPSTQIQQIDNLALSLFKFQNNIAKQLN